MLIYSSSSAVSLHDNSRIEFSTQNGTEGSRRVWRKERMKHLRQCVYWYFLVYSHVSTTKPPFKIDESLLQELKTFSENKELMSKCRDYLHFQDASLPEEVIASSKVSKVKRFIPFVLIIALAISESVKATATATAAISAKTAAAAKAAAAKAAEAEAAAEAAKAAAAAAAAKAAKAAETAAKAKVVALEIAKYSTLSNFLSGDGLGDGVAVHDKSGKRQAVKGREKHQDLKHIVFGCSALLPRLIV